MTRLFETLEEVAIHNARIHQQQRERRGLGEAVERVPEMPALLEKDLQGPILKALLAHPRIAFAWRANSGKFKLDDLYGMRWIVVNFKGCSDLLFMTTAGKFGACEVKREGEKPNPDQQAFLDRVNANGGVGMCVHSLAELDGKLRDEA